MRTIYVALPTEAFERLRDLAQKEFRGPKEQAVVLILAGLERDAADRVRQGPSAQETPAKKCPPGMRPLFEPR